MKHLNKIEVIARFKNALVHSYNKGELLYSSKNKIFKIKDLYRPEPEIVVEIPWAIFKKVFYNRTIDRIVRNSILQVHKTKNNEYLVTTRTKWWHIDSDKNLYQIKKFSDTRPMSRGICESKNGITYVAEYIDNTNKGPVKIFRSSDCKRFEIAWEFPPKSIRHIHALKEDPELKNRIWVMTGDLNHESHIFFTDNGFSTLNCFLSLGQKTRVTDIIIRNNHLIWAPDSGAEASIVCVRKDAPDNIKTLHKLPWSVFYTGQNKSGILYFGVVPSKKSKRENQGRIIAFHTNSTCDEILTIMDLWIQTKMNRNLKCISLQ